MRLDVPGQATRSPMSPGIRLSGFPAPAWSSAPVRLQERCLRVLSPRPPACPPSTSDLTSPFFPDRHRSCRLPGLQRTCHAIRTATAHTSPALHPRPHQIAPFRRIRFRSTTHWICLNQQELARGRQYQSHRSRVYGSTSTALHLLPQRSR